MILTLARGPGGVLRVEPGTYQGNDYVALRLWRRNRRGRWKPTHTGVTVQPDELRAVASTLASYARAYERNDESFRALVEDPRELSARLDALTHVRTLGDQANERPGPTRTTRRP